MEIYLSLGSNLGDRQKNMEDAVALLEQKLGVRRTALSSFLETEPWGFESESKFINAAVRFDLPENRVFPDLCTDARENQILAFSLHLLDICKQTEYELGRRGEPVLDKEGRRIYADRPIDIDILFIGTFCISSDRLTVPHPLMSARDFVLIPLSEIISQNISSHFPEIIH